MSKANLFDQFLAGEIFTSAEIRTNLEVLCDDLGSRFAGTRSEEEAAQFLHGKLQEYGLQDVRSEAFDYNGWTRGTARLTVTFPWQRELDCLSMPMSPSGRVCGKIVDLGRGAPETFEALKDQLKNNIALVNIANPISAARWIQRIEKYNRSVLAGAKAFLFMGNEPGYGPVTGALGFNRWGMIPGIMISRETGLLFQRLLRRQGSVEVEIETTDTLSRKTSWNIIGDIKDAAADKEMVIVGCHYDGHDISQGAEDPASGLVVALEIARVFSLGAGRLKHNVHIILFGVEELGLIGSQAYVDTHREDIDHTRFMLNLDAAGGRDPKGLFLYGPDTREYFRALSRTMNEDIVVDMDSSPLREPEHLSADHYPFMAQGIASGFIRNPDLSISTGFYHTAHDTVDKLRPIDMKEAAFLGARLAWRVANDDDWSIERQSAEELAQARAEYDKIEVNQIEEAVEELRRKQGNAVDRRVY